LGSDSPPLDSPTPQPRWHFLHNVLWSWLAVVANLIIGFVLTPYVIRKLGSEGYGIWTLLFSLISYYGLLDLGMRSAVVYYSAQYRARKELEKINQVISSIGFFYSLMSLVIIAVSLVAARPFARSLDVSPERRAELPVLLIVTSVSWLVSQPVFSATLEGFQRFDLSSRIYILTSAMRAVSSLTILWMGFGLIALTVNYLAIQLISSVASYLAVRKCFPELELSKRHIQMPMLKTMLSYGVHTFIAYIGMQFLTNGAGLIAGWMQSPVVAGYLNLPLRLLQQSSDIIARVGTVSSSKGTELSTHGKTESVLRLGILSNRYCCALYAPVAIFLIVYGTPLIRRWVSAEYVTNSAPLLPILTVAMWIGFAGQFNSSALLFSVKKHHLYARALIVEAVLQLAGLVALMPHFGLLGAAWAIAVPMTLVRGIYVAVPISRALDYSPVSYLASVFVAPLATAIPVGVAAYFMKAAWLPGATWLELFTAAALISILYGLIAFFTCIDKDHRERLLGVAGSAGRRLASLRA
jgi:O-antigen/teichoic acid export membrane protein